MATTVEVRAGNVKIIADTAFRMQCSDHDRTCDSMTMKQVLASKHGILCSLGADGIIWQVARQKEKN